LRDAKDALLKRLMNAKTSQASSEATLIKKQQVGSGMRGDKIRTYRFQEDRVVDHQSGKKAPCSKVLKGWFEKLWR
jgi:peptide chain release factor 1